MAQWEYVKGSEQDFEGAPDTAQIILMDKDTIKYHAESADLDEYTYTITAERRKVDNLQSRVNDANLGDALKEMFKDVPDAKVVIGSGIEPGVHSGPVYDVVQRPAHYNQSGVECIDAIAASMSAEEFQAYLKGNVQKYLWRYQHKNGVEDVRKAQWYLDRLVKELSK